jgi:hypothetical protein
VLIADMLLSDENRPDRYDVVYTATNKDGYDGMSGRTVYVVETGDLVNDIILDFINLQLFEMGHLNLAI